MVDLTKEPTWIDRRFMDLITDAILLAKKSADGTDPPSGEWDSRRVFARAAIVTSALSVEAAANCALDAFPRSSSIKKAVDKFSPLDKFDFLAQMRVGRPCLDRGRREVQAVGELMKARNAYVHAHPRRHRIDVSESAREGVRHDFKKTDGAARTDILGLADDETLWTAEDAVRVIRCVCDFVGVFFCDICGWSVSETSRFIGAEVVDGEEKYLLMLGRHHGEALCFAEREWGIQVRFADLAKFREAPKFSTIA